ncbi:MAG TPA: hypothetical protein PLG90_00800 [Ignavibacteria bacterium]|nr:hypothetical protein [Ignavibacteria bacterium]
MNNKTNQPQKIKRKKFFLLFGASVAGVIGLVKSPIKLFSTSRKDSHKLANKSNVKIEPSPLSVKREKKTGIYNS